MTSIILEYIWIDNKGSLRSKTKVQNNTKASDWSFDGSSTGQATAEKSDLILLPVKVVSCPLRKGPHLIALCEVINQDGSPSTSNYRAKALETSIRHKNKGPLFGIEQEYTLTLGQNNTPLGLAMMNLVDKPAPEQGDFYCGVGANNVFGRKIVEEHLIALSKDSNSLICGINAEVMPGQWEFQIGPGDPIEVADRLWIARYVLMRIAEKHGVNVSFAAKPHSMLNGAGAHTNFSTKRMRESINECHKAAQKLGGAVVNVVEYPEDNKSYDTTGFPIEYGTGYEHRLTGDCETASYSKFKFGIGDRTSSIRIPTHVAKAGGGYIEDRRPCANADPYRVVNYILETTLD